MPARHRPMAIPHSAPEVYRASFATLCAGTIDAMLEPETPPGRLLDVGCGTGELLERAKTRGWGVHGVDADASMAAACDPIAPGRVREAALPDLPFADASFDLVTANFVVNHVGDPRAAVRELGRLVAPGGAAVATIWPADGPGWRPLISQSFAVAGVVPLPGARLAEHLDFSRTPEGLSGLVREAGLSVAQSDLIAWTWNIPAETLWTGIAGGIATVGRTFLAQSLAVRSRVESEFFERADAMAEDGVLSFSNRAVLVRAAR